MLRIRQKLFSNVIKETNNFHQWNIKFLLMTWKLTWFYIYFNDKDEVF